jgi:Leucine rich repeat
MASTLDRPMRISPRGVDELVARAHAEQWQSLALIGPGMAPRFERTLISEGWNARQVFRLREPIEGSLFAKLAALTRLSSLALPGNQIGDEGARALAALTGLTSLHLWNNQIGDEGARALAPLTGVTSLNLTFNQIGAGGPGRWRRSPA